MGWGGWKSSAKPTDGTWMGWKNEKCTRYQVPGTTANISIQNPNKKTGQQKVRLRSPIQFESRQAGPAQNMNTLYAAGAVFQARVLGNQVGASTERYVFGILSATCFPRRHAGRFGTGSIPTLVDISTIDHAKSAKGGVSRGSACAGELP